MSSYYLEELAKLHGGSVRVSSVEGQGSTFDVSLPTKGAHLPAERMSIAQRRLPRRAKDRICAKPRSGLSPARRPGLPPRDS
jgi:hypothetical protein